MLLDPKITILHIAKVNIAKDPLGMEQLKSLRDQQPRPDRNGESRRLRDQQVPLLKEDLCGHFALHKCRPWNQILSRCNPLHFRRQSLEITELPGAAERVIYLGSHLTSSECL